MAPNDRELAAAILRSAFWRYGAYAVGLFSLMVLARVFTPDAFGVVAAVQVAYTLGLVLSESGFGPAIINQKSMSASARNGLFSATALFGVLSGALVAIAAEPIAALLNEVRALHVVPWVALAIGFAGASVVPLANLQRDQRFASIGAADAIGEAVSAIGAVTVLAMQFADPIVALALRLPLRTAVRFVVLQLESRKTQFGRPRIGADFSAFGALLHFSAYQLAFSVVNVLARNLDQVLVARYLGATSLGMYEKALQLTRYPMMLLTFAMTPALQPALRRHAEDAEVAEALHRRFVHYLAFVAVGAGFVLVLGAELIVRLLLGPGWESVVPVLRVLGVAVPVQIVLATAGSFFQAMGDARSLFVSGCLSAVVMIGAVVVGIASGSVFAVAWAVVVALHLNFLQAYVVLYVAVFKASPWRFFRALVVPALLQALLVAGAWMYNGVHA